MFVWTLLFGPKTLLSEAVIRSCSVEKVFLKILQNSQENTCARISLMQAWPEILAEVFSCQFCKISKSNFFTEHIWATTSDSKRKKLKTGVRAQLDLAKARLDLLMKASKHVNSSCSPSNVGVVYADINCRLKTYLSNNRESFFVSMDDLILKTENFLFSDSAMIFMSFCFKMILLSEVSMKEIL